MDYRRGRTPSLVGVGLLILAGSGAAQRSSPHFSTVHVPYAAEVAISDKPASPVLGVQPRVPRTHWLEGGLSVELRSASSAESSAMPCAPTATCVRLAL